MITIHKREETHLNYFFEEDKYDVVEFLANNMFKVKNLKAELKEKIDFSTIILMFLNINNVKSCFYQ